MNNLKSSFFKSVFLSILVLFVFVRQTSAQAEAKIDVKTSAKKTSICVTGFPKNVSIIVMDGNNNLLSVLSTNNVGAAFLSLNKSIKHEIIARTLNGEIMVSNETPTEVNREAIASVKTNQHSTRA